MDNSHLGGQAGEAGLEAGSDVEGAMERDTKILVAFNDRDAVVLETDVGKGRILGPHLSTLASRQLQRSHLSRLILASCIASGESRMIAASEKRHRAVGRMTRNRYIRGSGRSPRRYEGHAI